MNFIKEINAFEEWLETNPLPVTAQLLWYKLMSINNKCGWAEWFDLANSTLMAKAGISSEKTLISARNVLVDKGRILYKSSGNRKKAGKYKIIPFYPEESSTVVSNVKNKVVKEVVREVETATDKEVETAALNKLNKTKLNNNNNPEDKSSGQSPEKFTDDEKFIAEYLKEKLQQKGVTAFPRNWHLKQYSTAKSLLKKVTQKEVLECIDWALNDPYWRDKVDGLQTISKILPKYQLQKNNISQEAVPASWHVLQQVAKERGVNFGS